MAENGPTQLRSIFTFPETVNEVSARVVAGLVVGLTLLILLSQQPWLIAFLAYGFVARVLTGPSLSILGQLATRVITPRLGLPEQTTAGAPKRFAQGIGAALSISALVAHYLLSSTTLAYVLVAAVTFAASLEAFAGFCLGCWMFAKLIKFGVLPESVCANCADISGRLQQQLGQPVR